MLKSLVTVSTIVGLFAVGTLQAQIFDSSGPDAPLILFDAQDYDPVTAIWPNIGTGGATNNAFAPTAANGYGFLNLEPYYVNLHPNATANGDYSGNDAVDAADYVTWRKLLPSGGTMQNDETPGADPGDYDTWVENYGARLGPGPPTKTANAFAGTHDGVTFTVQPWQTGDPEASTIFPGQGLIYDTTGLPKGEDSAVTFIAVFNKQSNSKSGIIGFGKAETPECCLDQNDNLTLWTSAEQGPFPGYVEVGSDNGQASSDQAFDYGYHAGSIMVAAATVELHSASNDTARFTLREGPSVPHPPFFPGFPNGRPLVTVGPVEFDADIDTAPADLGHIGFYFDFRPRFMDGNLAMAAIIPGAISDAKREAIVNDLYERYVNGGNEPLIGTLGGGSSGSAPEPSAALLGMGAACGLLLCRAGRCRGSARNAVTY